MTTSAQLVSQWATSIWANTTIQAISKNAYAYDITQDSEKEAAKFYNDAQKRINFFTYLVKRSEERLMSSQVQYKFEVEVTYYREQDTTGDNWTTVRDTFETLFATVKTQLGQSWNSLVDFWQTQQDAPSIELTTLDSRPVWRGKYKFLATQTTSF